MSEDEKKELSLEDRRAGKGILKDPKTGRFLPGHQGGGRPPGVKNKITLLKEELELGAREENEEKALEVIRNIYEAALKGDRQARKMVWDAHMSKAVIVEDKTSGNSAPTINVKTMNVNQSDPRSDEGEVIEGEIIDGEHEQVEAS